MRALPCHVLDDGNKPASNKPSSKRSRPEPACFDAEFDPSAKRVVRIGYGPYYSMEGTKMNSDYSCRGCELCSMVKPKWRAWEHQRLGKLPIEANM